MAANWAATILTACRWWSCSARGAGEIPYAEPPNHTPSR